MLAVTKLKRRIKHWCRNLALKMIKEPVDRTNIPAALNDNFNHILRLAPRVTSFHEHVSLFNLSAISKGDVIEVGCYICYSSVMMASGFGDADRKLYAIDTFDRQKGWTDGGVDNWIFKNYSQKEFAAKTINECGLGPKVVLKQGMSGDLISEMKDLKNVGMIFIDGNHTYRGCEEDLNNYSPLLNSGGFLVMHDYINASCEVKAATDNFLKENSQYESLYLVNSMLVIKKN